MAKQVVKEGFCPKCGKKMAAMIYAGIPGRRDCKECKRVYEPIFGGYRVIASDEGFVYSERVYPATRSLIGGDDG